MRSRETFIPANFIAIYAISPFNRFRITLETILNTGAPIYVISEKKLWWRKLLSKWKSGGGKCHQNSKVMAKSTTTFQIWWNLSHHTHNCGGTLTTTYHIQGAGAPAKTKNYVNADAFIFFREKVRPFPHLAKPMNTFLRKVGKAMVQIKRDWFYTALENYRRGEMYDRWKEKIQI